MRRCLWALVLAAGAAIAACAGGGSSPGIAPNVLPDVRGARRGTPIRHVVIVIQENRSFDNFFATFPGADGATTGQAAPMPSPIASSCAAKDQPVIAQPTTIPLTKVSLTGKGFKKRFGWDNDLDHIYSGFLTEYDGGAMDGFDLVHFGADGKGAQAECTYAYQYVDPKDIAPYWDIAQQYVLADHMFDTQGSSSFTGHQDLIATATKINAYQSIIDNPSNYPKWGCDAPTGTTTSLITTELQYEPGSGPLPCFDYATLRDLLDAKKITWKYYAVGSNKGGAGIWSAFDAIRAVRTGPEWKTNVSTSPQQIFTDISKHKLPAVSWLTPDAANSDHPFEIINGVRTDNGPSWVASVVNAIGQSSYWDSSAIVILWDDPGGFYDHESPQFLRDDQGGLGFRVPMLIVSPYVQAHVEHTQYEDASIVKFIEQNWNLGKLGTEPEKRAASITNAFNFSQTPRPFQTISSDLHRDFFLRQKPSGLPVDTQ